MAQTDDDMKLDISDELIAERRAGAPGETPEDMHPVARWVVSRIDLLNNLVGKITCLLLVPVIGAMVMRWWRVNCLSRQPIGPMTRAVC